MRIIRNREDRVFLRQTSRKLLVGCGAFVQEEQKVGRLFLNPRIPKNLRTTSMKLPISLIDDGRDFETLCPVAQQNTGASLGWERKTLGCPSEDFKKCQKNALKFLWGNSGMRPQNAQHHWLWQKDRLCFFRALHGCTETWQNKKFQFYEWFASLYQRFASLYSFPRSDDALILRFWIWPLTMYREFSVRIM